MQPTFIGWPSNNCAVKVGDFQLVRIPPGHAIEGFQPPRDIHVGVSADTPIVLSVSSMVSLTPQLVRPQTLTDFRLAGCARNSSQKSKCRIAVELVADDTLEG
jgi:hypothetical protein